MTTGVTRFLRLFLRRHRRALGWLLVWSLAEAAPVFMLGRAVASSVDAFTGGDRRGGLVWLGVLLAAALAGAVGTRMVYTRLAAVVEPLRDELVRLVVSGALRRSGQGVADTGAVGRLTHQVEIVRDTFAGLLMVVFGFVFTAGAALAGLLTLAPVVLLFVLPPLLVSLGLFFTLLAALAARQRAYILADERLATAAGSAVDGLRDIVACGAEERVRAAAEVHVREQARAARALARLGALRAVILGIGGWLPVVLVLIAAPWLRRNGMSTGAILGALTYLMQGLRPALDSLAGGIGGAVLRLAVILGRILETSAVAAPDRVLPDARRGFDLELRGVTFSYGAAATPVIDDLDLDIPEGDHLAIVGPSGIGKSTLASLLTGMLAPQAGTVLLTDSRVLIPQEAYVFAGTLGANLTYLRPDASAAEVDEAIHAVGLDALAERLGGHAAEVVPAALSAGERQLIALCRAYLSPARVVVLDEATCHLDPATEARAEQAFARRDGTLVVIAHRISSALRARRILVMDGSHALAGDAESLLARSPLFRDLTGQWRGLLTTSPTRQRS